LATKIREGVYTEGDLITVDAAGGELTFGPEIIRA
jgi:hypothetical protein